MPIGHVRAACASAMSDPSPRVQWQALDLLGILCQSVTLPPTREGEEGDKVQVEMTPYDLSKGRINYRFK